MRKIDILKPHLVIWNCNRFDYAMWNNPKFYNVIRSIDKYHNKVTYIPWTNFEQLWCGKHGVHTYENTISSIGKTLNDQYTSDNIKNDFGEHRNEFKTDELANTIFVQKYMNHTVFMNLSKYLSDYNISTVWVDIHILKRFNRLKD